MKFNSPLNIALESAATSPLVLAVDDDEDNLHLMGQFLDLFGCSSVLATDGQTALFLAENHQPDLIVSDICLPDINGLELVYRLRNNPATLKIPIVAVTALAQQEDRQKILQAGCAGYLSKPYLLEDLEALVHKHLSFKRALF